MVSAHKHNIVTKHHTCTDTPGLELISISLESRSRSLILKMIKWLLLFPVCIGWTKKWQGAIRGNHGKRGQSRGCYTRGGHGWGVDRTGIANRKERLKVSAISNNEYSLTFPHGLSGQWCNDCHYEIQIEQCVHSFIWNNNWVTNGIYIFFNQHLIINKWQGFAFVCIANLQFTDHVTYKWRNNYSNLGQVIAYFTNNDHRQISVVSWHSKLEKFVPFPSPALCLFQA